MRPDGSSRNVDIEPLPNMGGQSGRILKTDGSVAFWVDPPTSELPSQGGHAGHYLTTDGATAYWKAASELPVLSSPPPIGDVTPNEGHFSQLSLGPTAEGVSSYKTNQTVVPPGRSGTIFSFSLLMYSSGDFHIQATTSTASQVSKITSIVHGQRCEWTEFDSVNSGGEVGPLARFKVQTDGGSNLLLVAESLTQDPITFKVTTLLTTV